MRTARVLGLSLAVVLLSLVAGPASAASAYPPPSGYVVDAAHVLPAPVVRQVAAELGSFEDRTAHQMAVVIVPRLDGQSVEDYARGLFDSWGIGRSGVNDGSLLLIAIDERRVRVQVGSGLQATLSDAKAVDVVNAITPQLHAHDYAAAVLAGERDMRHDVGDTSVADQDAARVAHFSGGRAAKETAAHQGSTPTWLVVVTLSVLGAVIAGLMIVASRGNQAGKGLGVPTGTAPVAGMGGVAGGGASGGGAVGGGGGASGSF
jgi:uncharacterized protein